MTDLRRALHRAVDRTASELDPSDLDRHVVRRHRGRQRRLVASGTIVAVVLVGLAVWATTGRSGDSVNVAVDPSRMTGVADVAGDWTRLPDGPLSPRVGAMVIGTGRKVLVVGGSDALPCPEGANCAITASSLSDGAAFDLDTRSWRMIAPTPLAFLYASTVVVDGDVYLLGSSAPEPPKYESQGPRLVR